ncbi:MAG: M20/M25/M40 family metallo-hydrolase [Desulfobulbaceae bacterium]|jgi:tripeptide aminopeptidase|nr:M20/M25/M40 family metallo-hydrolase [Desulfobulbaceae bacterium]
MNITINRERLAKTFIGLCEISSPSRHERAMADYLKKLFADLGATDISEDDSAAETGADSGNLYFRFQGDQPERDGFFFSCHMDTVQPGEGVRVRFDGEMFTSMGDTVLGGDDKSGIAAIIETMRLLKEHQASHPDIEILITTCEEIGLLGARCFDAAKVRGTYGYTLDSSGIDRVIIGAPAANKFSIRITGASAHAGLQPEMGINAIAVAAKAISAIKLGRLDAESTANFGVIAGGVATNIVPECVVIDGEVRSHDPKKLQAHSEAIAQAFSRVAAAWPETMTESGPRRPTVDIKLAAEYPAMRLAPDSPVARRIQTAGRSLGKELEFVIAGGGSDANIFNEKGLPTAIVATGMDLVHTTGERLRFGDLLELTRLLIAIAIIDDESCCATPRYLVE